MNLTLKQKQTQRTDLWLLRGGMEWEIWASGMDEQGPTVSTENYIQYPLINHNGKEHLKRMYIYIHQINLLYT